jgi:hypothetical protein
MTTRAKDTDSVSAREQEGLTMRLAAGICSRGVPESSASPCTSLLASTPALPRTIKTAQNSLIGANYPCLAKRRPAEQH